MSGYRQPGYEPNASQPSLPVRPYNKVQWIGVGFTGLAVAVLLVDAGQRLRLLPRLLDDPTGLVFGFSMLGIILVSSRRENVPPERLPELRRKQRRAVAIAFAVALIAVAIGFAATYISQGAK